MAITDVQNAQANYDLTIAEQVSSLNDLNNALEDLRQVSGRFISKLLKLKTHHILVNCYNFQKMPTLIY